MSKRRSLIFDLWWLVFNGFLCGVSLGSGAPWGVPVSLAIVGLFEGYRFVRKLSPIPPLLEEERDGV
jgi:hypothetical protein